MPIKPSKAALICKLHSDGQSMVDIAAIVGVSRNTVAAYASDKMHTMRTATTKGGTARSPLCNGDQEALQALYLQCNGNSVTISRILSEDPTYYGFPQGFRISDRSVRRFFRKHYPTLSKPQRVTGPLDFCCSPGEVLQIDFVTATYHFDGQTAPRRIHLFEAVYPWSHKAFVYVCPDMTQPSWLMGITKCLQSYGVPRTILCDNDRSLVIRRDGNRVEFHPLFAWLCSYIGIKPLACRVRRPQTKGAVERFGRYLQENGLVYCAATKMPIKDEADLQKALDKWLTTFSDERRFDHRDTGIKTTVNMLYEEERKFLCFTNNLEEVSLIGCKQVNVNSKGDLYLHGFRIRLGRPFALSKVVASVAPNGGFLITSTTTGEVITRGEIPEANMHKFGLSDEGREDDVVEVEDVNNPLWEYSVLIGEK